MKNILQKEKIIIVTSLLLFSIHVFAGIDPENTIEISGTCITETVVLSEGGTLNGKSYYTGIGTIWNIDDIDFAIYWDIAESKWLLSLSGQPYWYNEDDTDIPNSTLLDGNWIQATMGEGACDVIIQGNATNMPTPTAIETTSDNLVKIYTYKSTLNVHLQQSSDTRITIFNLHGQKLKEIEHPDEKTQVSDLANGIYIVQINTANKITSQKVIIKD